MKKFSRLLALLLTLVTVSALFVACTGDVPEPYVSEEVLASATVKTKVVVRTESEVKGEDPTEEVLLEKEILVTSTKMPAVSIRDLVNTMIGDENHINGTLKQNRTIVDLGGYEADDDHMWFWSLNGNTDAVLATAIKDGDSVTFIYAEKDADLSSGGDADKVLLSVDLKITAGTDVIYNDTYTVEDETSISVKNILKAMREEGLIDCSVAGSLKSVNKYTSGEGGMWKIYIEGEEVKPSASVRSGAVIDIVFEAQA